MAPDQLFARASPAVVRVVVRDKDGRTYGSGSGFVIGQGGMIATNYHVVEGASLADVLFADGRKAQCSVAVAADEAADLVLLQPSPRVIVPPLELAGDPPPVGTKVYAIGSPLGLSNTLSDGLVSGHRQLNGTPVIQTSAPISPGSSGGPLLTADGRVVGVTTAGARGGQNLNFAVTAGHVRRLVAVAESGGQAARFPLSRRAVSPNSSAATARLIEVTRDYPLSLATGNYDGLSVRGLRLGMTEGEVLRVITAASLVAVKDVAHTSLAHVHRRLPDGKLGACVMSLAWTPGEVPLRRITVYPAFAGDLSPPFRQLLTVDQKSGQFPSTAAFLGAADRSKVTLDLPEQGVRHTAYEYDRVGIRHTLVRSNSGYVMKFSVVQPVR
jgi:hypothetical protein